LGGEHKKKTVGRLKDLEGFGKIIGKSIFISSGETGHDVLMGISSPLTPMRLPGPTATTIASLTCVLD